MGTELERREAQEVKVWSCPPRYNGVPVVIFATLVVLFALAALAGALGWGL